MQDSENPTTLAEGRTRLRRLNINLLYALDALLHSPSLTAAAHAIAISQPAMSVKLRQLRDHFKDELVVFGERRQFTARGDALAIGSDLIVTTSNWCAQHQATVLPVTPALMLDNIGRPLAVAG